MILQEPGTQASVESCGTLERERGQERVRYHSGPSTCGPRGTEKPDG